MSAKFPRGGGGSKPILSHPSSMVLRHLFMLFNHARLFVPCLGRPCCMYPLINDSLLETKLTNERGFDQVFLERQKA